MGVLVIFGECGWRQVLVGEGEHACHITSGKNLDLKERAKKGVLEGAGVAVVVVKGGVNGGGGECWR